MLSFRNKTIALVLYIMLTIFSWFIILGSLFINIFAFIFSNPPLEVGLFGFLLTTIFLTIYTLIIVFKFNANAITPALIGIFHLVTLSNTGFLYFFIIIDVIVLILLNIASKDAEAVNRTRTFYYQFGPNSQSNGSTKSSSLQDNNVFDAEYNEHEER